MRLARAIAEGMIASTPNATARAVSCIDKFVHVNFIIGARGTTTGDVVRLFLRDTTGAVVTELALFQLDGPNARVISLNPNATLHLQDRLALSSSRIVVGDLVSLSTLGGALGMRSQVLTLSLKGLAPDCLHLGLDIKRAAGIGATSVVFPDLLVDRFEEPGDRSTQSSGYLTGIFAAFPRGIPCKTICPPCTPESGITLGATFNFRGGGTGHLKDWEYLSPSRLGGISSRNRGLKIDLISPESMAEITEKARNGLLEIFQRAQLVMISTERDIYVEAIDARLHSYGYIEALEHPYKMRDGRILAPDSTLRELYEETQNILAQLERVTSTPDAALDAMKLLGIWKELFGE